LELLTVSDEELFDDNGSAQYKAFDWIVENDPLFMCPDDANLKQRYILTVLYFSTSGDGWNKCTRDESTPCTGVAFLTGVSECQWGGIECDLDTRVASITLDANNLAGPIPNEIGSLTYLVELDLDDNALTGSLPPSLGQLKFLEIVDLDTNQLAGDIPESLYDATALRVLDLDSNALTGTISTQIGSLSSLYFVQLNSNQLEGSIPMQLGSLEDLTYLSLYQNSFIGPIPSALCESDLTLYANCDICTSGCCTRCLNQ
jgi:Leucine-rich repeat (LRR) protein